MADRTLADEIIAIIKDKANNNPPPILAEVIKTYSNNYVDVLASNLRFGYVQSFGNETIGSKGILIFLDGNMNNPFFISSRSSGETGDYVKKSEVDIVLMDNGYLKLKLDLEDE